MQKRAIVSSVILMMMIVSVAICAPSGKSELPEHLNYKIIPQPEHLAGLEEEFYIYSPVNVVPYGEPNRDDPMGDEFVVGWTWMDYQHNGSIGKMIAVDSEGNAHITWMAGYNEGQNPRHMLYNLVYTDGDMLYRPDERSRIDNGTQSGYGHIWLLPEDQRAVIFYHVFGHMQHAPNMLGTAMSVDWMHGIGAFSPFYPPPWAEVEVIWPKGALDRRNFAHIIATERRDEGETISRLGYWRGTPSQDFDQWQWGNQPQTVDRSAVISGVAATSRQSNKVAVAWHHNLVRDLDLWAAVPGLIQRNHEIRYIISENGEQWDWQNASRMTPVIPPRPELINVDAIAAWGDTFRPYCDVDIAFDPWENSDNLYGAFAAHGFWEDPLPNEESVASATGEHNVLFFWNSEHDTITMIFDAWYFSRTDNGGWKSRNGAWRLNADRPSIAFDPDEPGKIYVAWVNFPQIMHVVGVGEDARFEYLDNEHVADTSRMGYKNAEVMVSVSTDYGLTWREPVNVTRTIWDGNEAPAPGECMSEAWMSAAEIGEDGYLHLMYVRDGDAGGIAQQEGVATNSPIIYQKIPLEDIPLLDPVENPIPFHNHLQARPQIPTDMVMRDRGMVQPNQVVTVSAEVRASQGRELADVILEYSINEGANVLSVDMESIGENNFAGQIPGQAEGTYVWYRIRAIDDEDGESLAPEGWWWAYVVRNEGELQIRDIQYRPSDWTVDYSSYLGHEVTVTGVVTTPAGFANELGAYAIQDAEAEWSGVFVHNIAEELNIGDQITVTGTVYERDPNDPQKWRWATFIATDSYDVIANDIEVNPVPLDVLDIRGGAGSYLWNEPWEGVLVEVYDVIIYLSTGDEPLYWSIYDEQSEAYAFMTTIGLDDAQMENLGVAGFVHGTEMRRLTGVFTENYSYYAIAPRHEDDFEGLSVDDKGTSPTPYDFVLREAYPNPFNAQTKITFELPRAGYSKLSVYDLTGREVLRLSEGELRAGVHSLTVDASALASGVYMLRLESMGKSTSQKLVLVK